MSSTNPKQAFGRNLKRLRQSSPYQQKALAERFKVDASTWRRWENPDNKHWPPSYLLPELANIFNCSIDELFEHDPQYLPQTQDERELLMVARHANPKLPRHQMINALSLILGKLSAENRKVWLSVGNALANIKE